MASTTASAEVKSDPLVMYIFVRTDLDWPQGAVAAQACHASMAIQATHADDADMKAYVADLGNMHKVVKAVKSQSALESLAADLSEVGIQHHVWLEQPENLPTAIATLPTLQSIGRSVKKINKLKLLK